MRLMGISSITSITSRITGLISGSRNLQTSCYFVIITVDKTGRGRSVARALKF